MLEPAGDADITSAMLVLPWFRFDCYQKAVGLIRGAVGGLKAGTTDAGKEMRTRVKQYAARITWDVDIGRAAFDDLRKRIICAGVNVAGFGRDTKSVVRFLCNTSVL